MLQMSAILSAKLLWNVLLLYASRSVAFPLFNQKVLQWGWGGGTPQKASSVLRASWVVRSALVRLLTTSHQPSKIYFPLFIHIRAGHSTKLSLGERKHECVLGWKYPFHFSVWWCLGVNEFSTWDLPKALDGRKSNFNTFDEGIIQNIFANQFS